MMTLDEAIKHEREVAEFNKSRMENENALFAVGVGDIKIIQKCEQCAEEHEQLAAWLEELKSYREMDDKTYICDVDKNINCEKTFCHINGGECMRTTNKEFALVHDNEEVNTND